MRDCRHKQLTLYGGDIESVRDSLKIVCLDEHIHDTRDLFARRLSKALDTLTEIFRTLEKAPSRLFLDTLGTLKDTQLIIGPAKPDVTTEEVISSSDLNERLVSQSYIPPDSTVAAFQDRGTKLEDLKNIIVYSFERVIVITGMPGIGKTELINTLFIKALSDWSPIWINIASETSMARIITEIGSVIGITMDVDSLGSATEDVFRQNVRKVMISFFSTERNALILDDLRELRQTSRDYLRLKIFLEEMTDVKPYIGNRVFVLSSISAPPLWMQRTGVARVHVGGMAEEFIKRVLDYQLREAKLIPGENAVDVPQKLLEVIDGHPLVAKIAAIASAEKGLHGLVQDVSFEEIEANIVSRLLPDIELSAEEMYVARIISTFRGNIEVNNIKELFNIECAHELAKRAVIEFDGRYFKMHTLVRKYYYKNINDSEKKKLHKMAANYYSGMVSRDYLGHFKHPSVAFELVYHLALAGDFRELHDLRMMIYEEMYPAARTIYSQKQYDRALEIFIKLSEIRPKEPSVWAYIGRCYGRRGQWSDCDNAFEKALEIATAIKQPTSWIHRDWGHIRVRFGFYEEAIPHLKEARKVGKGTDLGILASEAVVLWRTGDKPNARKCFEDVLEINPNHTYTLTMYPKFLEEVRDIEYSKELRARLLSIRDEMSEPESFDFDSETDDEI